MRPTPSKKEVERWQLDRFLSALPNPPTGAIEPMEEPDFLISRAGGSLGIELTDLFHEHFGEAPPLQAQEALRFRIVKAAQAQYAAMGLPKLHVSVHFNPHYIPIKQDVPRLSQAIASLVAARVPGPGVVYSEDYDWENRAYFPEEINHVSAWHVPGQEAPFFQSPSAAFVPVLAPTDVIRTLNSKEAKVARYRQRANEVWLVINYDLGQLSTFFEHEAATLNRSYVSSFDKAFLFRHLGQEIHELALQKGGG